FSVGPHFEVDTSKARKLDLLPNESAANGCLTHRSTALALGAVLGTGLLAIFDSLSIQHTPNDMVADAGQIPDATAAHKHNRVFLQIVPLARNVGGNLDAAREANPCHFA